MPERLSKHSYLLSKDKSWLCSLAEDDNSYYGEILYGQKKIELVKDICFNNECYYKYWQLEGQNKKLTGMVGQATPYLLYYKTVSGLYPDKVIDHPVFGQVFKFNKNEVSNYYEPISYNKIQNMEIRNILDQFSILWGIDKNTLNLGGSVMIEEDQTNYNDLDILVNGKESTFQVANWLAKAVKNPLYKIDLKTNISHHRRFLFEGWQICTYAISENDNWFESANYEDMGFENNIEAEITSISESLFSPSVYTIRINNENIQLISYFVGHTFLFREGMKVGFSAKKFSFEKNGIRKVAYVIPFQGSWVEIL